jgi:predicted unusual protein kinase regulating ubiquinone biosynthesis (AarF/ABC1/UbiB family)
MAWSKDTDKEKIKQYNKEYYEKVRKARAKQRREELLTERECPICHGMFKPTRTNQKYCCEACKIVGNKLQHALYRQTEEYKEKIRAYRQTPEYKAKEKERRQTEEYKEYRKQYAKTETYKATMKRYAQSEKGKATYKKYEQSDKGKAKNKKYLQSEKGKATTQKYLEKRKANGWKSLYKTEQ